MFANWHCMKLRSHKLNPLSRKRVITNYSLHGPFPKKYSRDAPFSEKAFILLLECLAPHHPSHNPGQPDVQIFLGTRGNVHLELPRSCVKFGRNIINCLVLSLLSLHHIKTFTKPNYLLILNVLILVAIPLWDYW